MQHAFLNAVLYVVENGCKWRRLPGDASRRCRGIKRNGQQAIGKSRGGWSTKIDLVAADERPCALRFSLLPGQAGDGPQGRALITGMRGLGPSWTLAMDSADESNETCARPANLASSR
jgi:transposase